MKSSSLSAADGSLFPVQTCMLKNILQNCSRSSRELYFPHIIPRRTWIRIREMHEEIWLKPKPPYLICTPSAAVRNTSWNGGVTNLSVWESPITCLWFTCLRANDLDLTNFLIPEPSSSAERCSWTWMCWKMLSLWMAQAVLEVNLKLGRTCLAFF